MSKNLTDRQIREVAHDLLPCEHGRDLKLGDIARRNGMTRQTLNRLLSGRHSSSSLVQEYMRDMREQRVVSENKRVEDLLAEAPKSTTKVASKATKSTQKAGKK